MLGGLVVEELHVEHYVAQPVHGAADERTHPRRRAADDLVTRCREHMANIDELIARSRALRSS